MTPPDSVGKVRMPDHWSRGEIALGVGPDGPWVPLAEYQSLQAELTRLQALARGPQQAGGEDDLVALLRDRAAGGDKLLESSADALQALQAEVARWQTEAMETANYAAERIDAAEAALREAHTLPETWRNKWDGGCCCDAAGHECADALDAAIGGTGDA